MKQISIKKITGKLIVKTGLHIGAGNDKVEIGGVDSPIIKNPLTQEPYIPGSSIKGKMRSLMEWDFGVLSKTMGKPCNCGSQDCKICRVFGSANNSSSDNGRGPTRLIVRDAILFEKWSKSFKSGNLIVEQKNENFLNRINANATPRSIERVVPGVEFEFELLYKVIDTGDNGKMDLDNFESVVKKGLKMLESDYLGGGGSRGNGQIEFADLKDENGAEIKL